MVENPGFWNWTFTLKDINGEVLGEIDHDWRGFGFEVCSFPFRMLYIQMLHELLLASSGGVSDTIIIIQIASHTQSRVNPQSNF